jgi:photosystem II stability/assembly factor-like uncharacterized protein
MITIKEVVMKPSIRKKALLLLVLALLGMNVLLFACGNPEKSGSWVVEKKIPMANFPKGTNFVAFQNDQFGVAVCHELIYTTRDGGQSWIKQGPEGMFYYVVDIFDEKVFAVGSQMTGTLISYDGGASFSDFKLPTSVLMFNFDAQNTVAVSDGWELDLLRNGKEKKETVKVSLPFYDFQAFSAVNDQVLYFSKDGILWKTIDGGKTWDTIDLKRKITNVPFKLDMKWSQMRFSDANNGMILTFINAPSAKGWYTFTTVDGGQSWSQEKLDGLPPLAGAPYLSRDGSLITVFPFSDYDTLFVMKKSN